MGQGSRDEEPKRSAEKKRLMYGELIVVGYNGSIQESPAEDKGRRRSKLRLYKRSQANGVKPVREYRVKQPKDCKAVQDQAQHSVSYSVSKSQTIVVEYTQDADTDMFQIGRSSEDPIDMIVLDTMPGAERTPEAVPPQSTISRFACRILVDRKPPYTARVYAAGFDTDKNIFLGEKAAKWSSRGEVDGLTTNGVMLNHPKGSFSPGCQPGVWREVSVGGSLFALRESRSQPQKSAAIEDEENILADGTLIDLCGATLLWRSALSLMSSPSRQELEYQVAAINAMRPQCPVGLNTLIIPSRTRSAVPEKQPYVYLTCGHVHGHDAWEWEPSGVGEPKKGADRQHQCPLCRKVGPLVKLQLALETSMYVDREVPSHCFLPCGHMASEATTRYWSNIPIPHGCHGFRAVCPFCATPITGSPGYVRLIFQEQAGY